MFKLKNITDEDHKELLKSMLISHYKEIVGPDLADKIPFRKLRELLSVAHGKANIDMNELFGQGIYNTIAFGLYSEEVNDYLGFALIDIMNQEINGETDTFGQLYQLYVKPEYREYFKANFAKGSAVNSLKEQLEDYFRCHDVNEVIMLIPKNIGYLIELNRDLGFEISKDENNLLETIYSF